MLYEPPPQRKVFDWILSKWLYGFWAKLNDLGSVALDDGTKGFHLVKIPLTQAEDTAGVSPTNLEYPTYDIFRYNGVSDAIEGTDGAITATDKTFTSASASFVAGDVGKSIAIFDAGSTTTSLITTIASINSSTSIELTDAAGTTVSGTTYQYGTDNTTAFHNAIDSIHSGGGGILVAKGKFFTATKVQLRADNAVYDFRGAKFYGNNFSCLDDNTTTHQVINVLGYGGEFNPIGDTKSSGNVNYNALAFVHCHNVQWYSPIVKARQGTRGISLQASNGHGASPFVNITDVHIHNAKVFGGQNVNGSPSYTNDGIDITSDTNGTDMIQDCSVTGYVEGCDRGLNNAAGSSAKRHQRIDLDVVIKDPQTMGATSKYSVDSKQRIRVIDAITEGIDVDGPEGCDFEFEISGSGASLTDAVSFADNSADVTNTASIIIRYDGTNVWTRGVVPALHGLFIKHAYIDGATTGIDISGYRTAWGSVVLRNCTTLIDSTDNAADAWSVPVVNFGTGANPQHIAFSLERMAVDNGDADATLTVGSSDRVQRWATALTTTRNADLQTSGAYEGATFKIVRPASGGSNLAVKEDGGATIKNIAASEWGEFTFNGSNWIETAFGSL